MNITYRAYDVPDHIPLNEDRWDEIVARSGVGGIFLQRNWITAWWHHLAEDERLCFVTAEDETGVIAFAPLMIDRHGALRFTGDLNSDYLGFAVPIDREDLIAGFLDFIYKRRKSWKFGHLRNVPADSTLGTTILEASRRCRLHAWRNYSASAPYLKIAGNAEAVDAIVNKYSLKRAARQLAAQGKVEFRVFTDIDEARPHWESFAAQHVSRCRFAGRSSPFSNPDYVKFLRSVFESPSPYAKAHFSAILLSGIPVAYHYGFVSQNRLVWYKPSFDPAIQKASPGLVLIRELLRHARDTGLEEFDMTIGEETFKDRFSDGRRIINSYRIHKSRGRAMGEKTYWRIRRGLKALLRA